MSFRRLRRDALRERGAADAAQFDRLAEGGDRSQLVGGPRLDPFAAFDAVAAVSIAP